ncbi:MAG: type I glutamate--ammonia ligase [candidate division WOR-3 bacterium]
MNEIIKEIDSRGIEVIRLWFTDILGNVKGFNITREELERALEEGIGFDGSSIEGFVRIEESDLIAKPDLNSYFFLENFDGNPSVVFICDILYPDGSFYESCPRHVLKRNLNFAKELGFDFYVGPELEYFYFKSDKEVEILDRGGYFDILPIEKAVNARKETLLTLRKMGIMIEATHHEVAFSQHEIDFRYQKALKMADIVQVSKVIIKHIARKYGIYATFMPKPVFGINGSGFHCHISLFKGEENAFYSENDEFNLSEIAKGFIAGLLKHAREITAVTNQWVNSYKRLVVGYEAPVYLSWGRKNRSALVRVPAFKPYKPKSCRIEYRAPDPACNPYLAFSVILRAGLKGVIEKYPLREPIEEDIYAMPEEVKRKYGIDSLPDSLYSAILEMEKSELVKSALGEEVFTKFIRNKKKEWEDYRIQVTDYELKNYLPLL